MSYLCTCGDWERAHEDGGRCRRWRECGCELFEPDDEAMKDLEDQAKILRHDIETGK